MVNRPCRMWFVLATGMLAAAVSASGADVTASGFQSKYYGMTDKALWIWSGEALMDLDRYQALKMTVKAIDGGDYLFIEAGGLSANNPVGWKTQLYVMKRSGK